MNSLRSLTFPKELSQVFLKFSHFSPFFHSMTIIKKANEVNGEAASSESSFNKPSLFAIKADSKPTASSSSSGIFGKGFYHLIQLFMSEGKLSSFEPKPVSQFTSWIPSHASKEIMENFLLTENSGKLSWNFHLTPRFEYKFIKSFPGQFLLCSSRALYTFLLALFTRIKKDLFMFLVPRNPLFYFKWIMNKSKISRSTRREVIAENLWTVGSR